MGQYWEFINIERRQSTGGLGKMGEFFFSDSTDEVMYLLAVPASPLDVEASDKTSQTEIAGSWAGDRIICLGDYAETWPEGKISSQDVGGRTPGKFTNICRLVRKVEYGWQRDKAYPPNRVWVLRNLTKKLYVRSNGIPTERRGEYKTLSYDHHKGFTGIPGLGTVLVSRIGWSDDFSISMAYEDDISLARGSWAADRFDVRLFDDVQEELSRDDWIDQTRVEAKRIFEIWKSDNEDYVDDDFQFPEEPEATPETH